MYSAARLASLFALGFRFRADSALPVTQSQRRRLMATRASKTPNQNIDNDSKLRTAIEEIAARLQFKRFDSFRPLTRRELAALFGPNRQ